MTTTREQLLEALQETGEPPEDIVCFYRPVNGAEFPGWDQEECGDLIQCSVDELPKRQFNEGYGAPMGEPFIAFGPRYVYIKVQYDGAEWIEPIPRHPEFVKKPLPWPGG